MAGRSALLLAFLIGLLPGAGRLPAQSFSMGRAAGAGLPLDSSRTELRMKLPAGDRYFAPDKARHFMTGFLGTVFSGKILERQGGMKKTGAQLAAGGIIFSLGIGKEIRDGTRKNNHFCWKDLLADALGVAAGMAVLNQP